MNTDCSVGLASASDRVAYKTIKFPLVSSHCGLFPNTDGLYSSNYLLIFEMAFLHPNNKRALLKRLSDGDISRYLRNEEMKKHIGGSIDEMQMLRVS
jgi:hypothetical protein